MRATTIVLVAAAVGFSWAPRLRWGLSLDETFSAWQAEGGWSLARTKLANPGQSVLFGYVEALFYFPHAPSMEVWLRVPAVVGALVSTVFVYRLAESLVGRGAGASAVVPFLANPYVVRLACEARPYTLATAAALAALWSLRQWLEGGGRRHRVVFSVCLALVPYLHLIYLTFAVAPALLVLAYVVRGRRVDWRGLAAALALAAGLLVPLLPFARDLGRRSAGLSFMEMPGWPQLLDASTPGTVLLALVGLVPLLPRLARRPPAPAEDNLGVTLAVAGGWFLLPPLFLFVVSRATGQVVLIGRYLLHTVAAQALVVAALYRPAPRPLARVALLLCFLPVPLFLGAKDWARADGVTSCRAPLRAVREIDPAGAAPLFVQAGHPLSNQSDWRHGPEQGSFHYSQLVVYPVPNRVFPLPFTLDEATKDDVRAAADGALRGASLILFEGEPESATAQWVKAFFEARGYGATFAARQGFALLVLRRA